MNWRSWLHKLTAWDLALQVAIVLALIVIAVVLVSLEDCSGRNSSDVAAVETLD